MRVRSGSTPTRYGAVQRPLRLREPASLRVCTLLDKRARRLVELPVDYIGFEIPDEFVVGYGLDYRQRFRNLPFVATLRDEALFEAPSNVAAE